MTHRFASACQAAFSLVELSIVLVILGLLTGGILSGQSLIRASEIRAVITEYQRYNTAVQGFRDKYFAIPGDFNNATAFWGKSTGTGCVVNSGTSVTTPGTCDGDGNGTLTAAGGNGQTGEDFQFWRQLALAGLVEGTYSGNAGAGSLTESDVGINVPKSKMNNSGWSVHNIGNIAGDNLSYALDYGNAFMFGAAAPTDYTYNPSLKPEEAWNIDTKLDDGKPATGKVIARYWATTPTSCSMTTAKTDLTGNYTLSNSSTLCALYFIKAF
jgi:prepilin-type N-terminal cleavage/methylation domain-containing protein